MSNSGGAAADTAPRSSGDVAEVGGAEEGGSTGVADVDMEQVRGEGEGDDADASDGAEGERGGGQGAAGGAEVPSARKKRKRSGNKRASGTVRQRRAEQTRAGHVIEQ